MLLQRKTRKKDNKDHVDVAPPSQERVVVAPHTTKSPSRNITPPALCIQPNSTVKLNPPTDLVTATKTSSNGQPHTDKPTSSVSSNVSTASKPDSTKVSSILKPAEKFTGQQQVVGLSRPSSAPLIPGTLAPPAPVVSMVQAAAAASSAPLLSRSISAAGRLGPDPSPSPATGHPYIPQSYRNAILGNSFSATSSGGGFTHPSQTANAMVNSSTTFSQQPNLVSNPVYLSPVSERMEQPNGVSSGMSFPPTHQDELLGQGQSWMESPNRRMMYDSQSMLNDIPNYDLYHRPMNRVPHDFYPSELLSVGPSGRQVQSALADEFPHLDIINDLLDDEQVIGRTSYGNAVFQGLGSSGPTLFNRQLSYPTDISLLSEAGSSCRFDRSRSYPDDGGFQQQDYGGYDSVREFIPQGNPMPYMNGQIDSLVPNQQWQLVGPDLSLLSMRSSGSGVDGGYSYNIPEYSNMACGVNNNYAMFRPSNGH